MKLRIFRGKSVGTGRERQDGQKLHFWSQDSAVTLSGLARLGGLLGGGREMAGWFSRLRPSRGFLGGSGLTGCMALLSRTPTAGVLAKLSIEGGPGDDIIRVTRFLVPHSLDYFLNSPTCSAHFQEYRNISKFFLR